MAARKTLLLIPSEITATKSDWNLTEQSHEISKQIEVLQSRMLEIIDAGLVEENLDVLSQMDAKIMALMAAKESLSLLHY